MADNRNNGKGTGKNGKAPAGKSERTKNSPAAKQGAKTGSGQAGKKTTALDTVRGRNGQETGRAREAARQAAARSAPGKNPPAKSSSAPAKNPPAKSSSAPAKGKTKTPARSSRQVSEKVTSIATAAGGRLSAADLHLRRRMIAVAVGVIVLAFLAIQAVSCANSQVASRQTVMVTLSDNIETTGIAIRNESVITSDQYGVIVSTIENGGKVSKDEAVANVFNSTDAARAYIRMAEIEEALAQFESLATAGEDSAAEVKTLEKSIRQELMNFSKQVYRGNVDGANESSDELLYLLNKTQVATRIVDDFSQKTAQLENELKDLQTRYPDRPGQLKSPLSGYYISSVDGYENLLSSESCEGLTPERLEEIIKLRHEPDNSMVVGKIADDYTWYMACEVSAEDAERLEMKDGEYVKRDYTLYLAYSELDSITAKLVSVNTGADNSRRMLVFECSYMVSELATVRIQPVTIELSSYSGLEINTDSLTSRVRTVSSSDIREWDMEGREALARAIYPAMFAHENVSGGDVEPAPMDETNPYCVAAHKLMDRHNDKMNEFLKDIILPKEVTYTQQGVFIVWGNEIKFKRVMPVYVTGDKMLCEYNLSESCLRMYDMVVDNPEEVRDGQIVNYAG